MPNIDIERLTNEPIYAFDFQFMIGDIGDFLDFSEINMEWQYRRELLSIKRQAEAEEFPNGYREHLETNAEHRFKVSLPLRVRYGAVIALATSVEWSVGFLTKKLNNPLTPKPKKRNETVHALIELNTRTGSNKSDVVSDYETLIHIRNCIAHNAGIVQHYRHHEDLATSIARLRGFSLDNWHFFGKHVCIERGALNPHIDAMGQLIVILHKACHEKGLLNPNHALQRDACCAGVPELVEGA